MDELVALLDKLATKLGVAVETLGPVLVQEYAAQAKVYVYLGLGIVGMSLLGGVGLWHLVKRGADLPGYEADPYIALAVGLGFLSAGLIIGGLVTIGANLGDVVAPTYGLLKALR